MSWLLVFLGFIFLIVIHEAGHFFAAKATGMRVERFFLFFPPKLVSTRRGETEYGIGAIPLGGFVKITGMNPDEELPPEVEARGYYRQPVWKRIVVIGAGPAVNIVLAFAILFVLAFNTYEPTQTVDEVKRGTPAAAVLHPGDRILAVDGRTFPGVDSTERLEGFIETISSHKCAGRQVDGCRAARRAELTVERDGRVLAIPVRPEYDAAERRTRVGFGYGARPAELGAAGAAAWALDRMWEVTSATVDVFANILDPERRREVSGVVGVSDVGHQVIDKFGATQAFMLLALVSLSLGLINLFPFLPLDGGHIFWSLVEKARGKPVPFRVMERAGALGFVLVIMLFFIGLSNDIGRLTGEGFDVR
jgi:regulator of sigma E protease